MRGLSLVAVAMAVVYVWPAAVVVARTVPWRPAVVHVARARSAAAAGRVRGMQVAVRPKPGGLTLQLGADGPAVRAVQRALARLSYLPAGGVDGRFGVQTWNAVVAFQGWSGLRRDGVVGPGTSRALRRAERPTPWSDARGIEIHLQQQVLLLISAGRVQRAVHVSTGAGATTPAGHFAIYRRDPLSWSVLFRVWMPLAQYFYAGFALHEFASVPAYPASHGCIRIPPGYAQEVWRFGSTGMRVWTRA